MRNFICMSYLVQPKGLAPLGFVVNMSHDTG